MIACAFTNCTLAYLFHRQNDVPDSPVDKKENSKMMQILNDVTNSRLFNAASEYRCISGSFGFLNHIVSRLHCNKTRILHQSLASDKPQTWISKTGIDVASGIRLVMLLKSLCQIVIPLYLRLVKLRLFIFIIALES